MSCWKENKEKGNDGCLEAVMWVMLLYCLAGLVSPLCSSLDMQKQC